MDWAHFKGGVTANQYNIILTETSILECNISIQGDSTPKTLENYLIGIKKMPLKSPNLAQINSYGDSPPSYIFRRKGVYSFFH